MQSQKLQSRVWSSSDLLLGASQVVDMAAFPAGQMLNADAAAIQLEIGDLSVEELEQLMEDISLVALQISNPEVNYPASISIIAYIVVTKSLPP